MKTFALDRSDAQSVANAYAAAQAEIDAMRKAGTPPTLIETGDASIDVYAPGDAIPTQPAPGPVAPALLPLGRWSFKKLLNSMGIRAAVEAYVAAPTTPIEVKDAYADASEFVRTDPLLEAAIGMLSLDPAAVDAAWMAQAAKDGTA